MNYISLTLSVVLVALSVASGCFITNCPPGGKRSGTEAKIRQCEACGPPGAHGRCYGPSICCSPEFGCSIATPDTFACQLESRFTTLCQNPGASCSGQSGEIQGGQCGADNVCCNSETCSMDDTCHDYGKSLKEESAVKSAGLYHHGYPLDIVLQRLLNGPHSPSHPLTARLPLPTLSPSSRNNNNNNNNNSDDY